MTRSRRDQINTGADASLRRTARPMVQQTCACGQHTPGNAECDDCRQKRETALQRPAVASEGVPPIVTEVLRTPGDPLDTAGREIAIAPIIRALPRSLQKEARDPEQEGKAP